MDSAKNITSLVRWIKQKISASHTRGCVLGLSGGIDSAVVAALVKKAVGKNHLALIMPCGTGNVRDMEDALSLVKKFHLNYAVVDIKPVYDSFLGVLSRVSLSKSLNRTNECRLAAANIKPRLRMATLYYFANVLKYLVVGTGNKSEISVGYFTKYGDGGVDILPLAGFYKSEVVSLAKALNIPSAIIKKPPSAGLWEGQTDEGEMGVRYDDIEKILRAFLRQDDRVTIPRSGFPSGINKSLVKKVIGMYNNSWHKRKMPEIFIPVG